MSVETDNIENVAEGAKEMTKEEQERKLGDLVAAGRRFIRLGEYDDATAVLSDAAELSTEMYGENHENTFDSIYYYAMATFEYGKKESQLLASQHRHGSEESEGGADEEEQKEADEKDENEEAEKEKEEGEEDDDVEDDDDSMKAAWELLEAARCIASAKVEQLEHDDSSKEEIQEWQLKKAEVLALLGEHGIADGKYVDAQEDLVRALDIQKAYLLPTSRVIAQTYMLIANACGLDARYDESVSYYQKTEQTLIARAKELEKKLLEASDEQEKSDFQEELKELEKLMPDIETMIADAINSAAQADEVKKQMKAQFEGFTSALAQLPQGDVEANDISNMVRRKRPTGDVDKKSDESKKSKEEGISQV